MKSKLSIGEMSKLHNISIKALRYYDQIDLFKPVEVDSKSGYRYYSVEQFETLNTITYLKQLGVPLKEIKKHADSNDIEEFLNILKREKILTDQRLKEMEIISRKIDKRIHELEEARKINVIGQVEFKKMPRRKILTIDEKVDSTKQIEFGVRKLANKYDIIESIMIGRVGMTIDAQDLIEMDFPVFSSIYSVVDEETVDKDTEVIEEGIYATLYYRGGDHKESPKWYKVIRREISNNGYEIVGKGYERVLVDRYISKNEEDFLTEIQVLVKKL